MSDKCLYCEEPIAWSDKAETVTHLAESGPEKRKIHFECGARRLIGSVGHQRKLCGCFGGTVDDPPGMSRREGARAALEWFQFHQGASMEVKQ